MNTNEWVRQARKRVHLTQDGLAEMLEMSKGNVSGWENGRHKPSFEQMKRISTLTGFPLPLDETPFMRDIDEIRRSNLQLLEGDAGGTTEAARRCEMTPSQFANLRDGAKDSKSGKPRGMRKETARRIEAAFGKSSGWLDVDRATAARPNVSPAPIGAGGPPSIAQALEVVASALERADGSTQELAACMLIHLARNPENRFRIIIGLLAMLGMSTEHVPNATTRAAIAQLEAGKGKRFATVQDLMADLHADDATAFRISPAG